MSENLESDPNVSQEELDTDSVTMLDVLEEEQEQENDANAVLGNSNDKECSYGLGYVKRQPLYSCKTCSDVKKPSGVCLACSYHCHEGHELVELYTKRNFRCDCGNDTQPNMTCKLLPKTSTNDENVYNQNFSGLYCTCSRPYPDEDESTADDMIQCVICEDWYHGKHLLDKCGDNSDFGEMTCQNCTEKCPFLSVYSRVARLCAVDAAQTELIDSAELSDGRVCATARASTVGVRRAVFWRPGWRQQLCACADCIAMYGRHAVSYLCDDEDSVAFYERVGRIEATSYDRGMQALSSMDRVQQVEVVHEYNNLKSQLMDYLKKFADNKKVVREEDIKEFFSGLNARKKPRFAVPDTCR